ncbi:MAG: hypothetical protein ACF8AM_14860 [Rhodopirellula sp. JB055]
MRSIFTQRLFDGDFCGFSYNKSLRGTTSFRVLDRLLVEFLDVVSR